MTESEAPKPEAPKPEAPKPEAPKPEAPKPEAPKPEAPKPEAPKPEAPKPEAPKPEAPKPEAPKPEAPKPKAPKPKAPKPKAPKPKAPKPEVPKQQTRRREVVVVLGVGRSGTSLAMQALETLGIRTSENLIPANVSNPRGFQEDSDIVEIHKSLLGTLTPNLAMPLPDGWRNTPEADEALAALKALVQTNLNAGPGLWAFKDPRTATFLPLWIRLFNQLKIIPRFVLAVRRPEAVIESFSLQYASDKAFAELVFLLRTLDALYYTGGDCFLLSYESWFDEPETTLQQLADFVFDQPTDIAGKEPPAVAKLDRNRRARGEIRSPLLRELCQRIQECKGQPDRWDALMDCVLQQREILETFKPWWIFAMNQKQEALKYRSELVELKQKLKGSDGC